MIRTETRDVLEVREIGFNGKKDTMRKENDDANKSFDFDLDFQIEKYHFGSCKERLRTLFDQVLVGFLRDGCTKKCIRPIPALCSNGRPVDLFKLFWLVRRLGGYEVVSRNNLWGFVCEECGLGSGVIASVKLIYVKYLNDLDQWLRKVFSKRVLENDHDEFVQKLDSLYCELEIRFRGLIPYGQKQEEQDKYDQGVVFGIGEVEKSIDDNIAASEMAVGEKTGNKVGFSKGKNDTDIENSYNEDSGDIVASAAKTLEKVIGKILNCEENIAIVVDDDDNETIPVEDKNVACISDKKADQQVIKETLDHSEKVTDNEERSSGPQSLDDVITIGTDVGTLLDSRKRKREFHSFSGTLSWLTHVAKHSDDPSVGLIPEPSKWKDCGNEEFWAHALLIREALLVKKDDKTAAEVPSKDSKKKPRMGPSMYSDAPSQKKKIPDHQPTEKQRFSKRKPCSNPRLCPCCNPCSAPRNKEKIHQEVACSEAPSEVPVIDLEKLPSSMKDKKSLALPERKKISVGRQFQAEVPEWTGVPSESDPKWLGITVWRPSDGNENSMDPIRTRTHHSCNCLNPGFVECVRFHIAEKRFKLRQEIGRRFYDWHFNRMGEEVSLAWTEEEEQLFKDKMRDYTDNPYSNKFWKNAWRFLPNKTREKLVSYYFNVYVIQRRSYQNRVTPKEIDSDDDVKNCGAIGGRLGHNALIVPGSQSISCILNEQSNELV